MIPFVLERKKPRDVDMPVRAEHRSDRSRRHVLLACSTVSADCIFEMERLTPRQFNALPIMGPTVSERDLAINRDVSFS